MSYESPITRDRNNFNCVYLCFWPNVFFFSFCKVLMTTSLLFFFCCFCLYSSYCFFFFFFYFTLYSIIIIIEKQKLKTGLTWLFVFSYLVAYFSVLLCLTHFLALYFPFGFLRLLFLLFLSVLSLLFGEKKKRERERKVWCREARNFSR